MDIHKGIICTINVPIFSIKKQMTLITNNGIKTLEEIDGSGGSHLTDRYHMVNDKQSYGYNDISLLSIQPIFNAGEDVKVWFEDNKKIHISQNTRTNYGYIINGKYKYKSKNLLSLPILAKDWGGIYHLLTTCDRIRYVVEKYRHKDGYFAIIL